MNIESMKNHAIGLVVALAGNFVVLSILGTAIHGL